MGNGKIPMVNKYYQTYPAWRRAIKSIAENNGRDFKELLHGDKDIADCYICGVAYGEWDGDTGIIESLKD